ncbi:MAG TPA: hypothetical protein VJR93_09005 [Chthoniobacterales bacterium]|nr:hypothetical protein [Chthoniobacterales bacterium]
MESLAERYQKRDFFIDDFRYFVFPSVVKVGLLLTCLLAVSVYAQNVEPTLCGPYPKNYKEIVWNWLQGTLLDADSAKIEWQGDPKPADLGKNGEHIYGWLVEFRVNSRNRFGQYTGKQSHGALIRDDQVIMGTGFGYGK